MRRVVSITIAVTAATAACGVPQSSEFEPIGRENIQFDMDATTTTSSSTVPPTTIDATTSTQLVTTSTISTEDVLIYFVAGSQINPVTLPLARPASASQVMAKLLEGPPTGDIGTGLRSTILPGAQITVTKASGVGIIDLPAGIFDAMPSRDQRLFFAQIVLTIGRLGGIGPVQFTLAGVPTRVQRGDGTTTEPGDAVTVDDYAVLLTGSTPAEPKDDATPPPDETPPGTTIAGG
ncbi:MAG: GerMN domain-containing protein [Ilumatobacteraceae bacterium]